MPSWWCSATLRRTTPSWRVPSTAWVSLHCVIHVGVSGPGVVRAALAKVDKTLPIDEIADIIKKTAFKITRMGQLVGTEASRRLGVPFGIVDLSLAPTPAVGDSVAHILEEMGSGTVRRPWHHCHPCHAQ